MATVRRIKRLANDEPGEPCFCCDQPTELGFALAADDGERITVCEACLTKAKRAKLRCCIDGEQLDFVIVRATSESPNHQSIPAATQRSQEPGVDQGTCECGAPLDSPEKSLCDRCFRWNQGINQLRGALGIEPVAKIEIVSPARGSKP